jgi:hypothetical protein
MFEIQTPHSSTREPSEALSPTVKPSMQVSTVSATPTAMPSPSLVPTLPTCAGGFVAFQLENDGESGKPQDGVYLACPDFPLERLILPKFAEISDLMGTTDGTKIFVVSHPTLGSTLITRIDLADQQVAEWLRLAERATFASWSPDAQYVGYTNSLESGTANTNSSVKIMHMQSQAVSEIATGYNLQDFHWSTSGTMIYYTELVGAGQESNRAVFVEDIRCDPMSHMCQTILKYHFVDSAWGRSNWSYDSSSIISIPNDKVYRNRFIRFTSLDGTVLKEMNIGAIDPTISRINEVVQSPNGTRMALVAESPERLECIFILDLKNMSLNKLEQTCDLATNYYHLLWLP